MKYFFHLPNCFNTIDNYSFRREKFEINTEMFVQQDIYLILEEFHGY